VNKKRILIVDDEAGAARLLKLNLERTNDYVVQVETVSSRALPVAEQFRPDLILLDVLMPGQDGGEVANRVHASARLDRVPIVFFTAATTREEVTRSGGLIGGSFFLAKPAGVPEVIACLEEHLGKPARSLCWQTDSAAPRAPGDGRGRR
jgi:DNA-binding response OmpR family regulator